MMPLHPILITGCSGGGKSTLIAEMARRGWTVREEPGRRVVLEEQASDGSAVPWKDVGAFEDRCLEIACADYASALRETGPVFCDRGVIDALCHRSGRRGLDAREMRLLDEYRYAVRVAFAPPWPELFRQDPQRRHGFQAAIQEVEALRMFLPAHGYEIVEIPRLPVADRADWLEALV